MTTASADTKLDAIQEGILVFTTDVSTRKLPLKPQPQVKNE